MQQGEQKKLYIWPSVFNLFALTLLPHLHRHNHNQTNSARMHRVGYALQTCLMNDLQFNFQFMLMKFNPSDYHRIHSIFLAFLRIGP